MKKLFLLASLLISTTSNANEFNNFNEVKKAVITGKTIHIVFDFSQCASPNSEIGATIGIFTPNAIVVKNDRIVTSLTHFTSSDPYFPGKPVYEFVRYTITDDNNVNLTNQVLNAVNYESLSDKVSFNCKLGNGAKIYD